MVVWIVDADSRLLARYFVCARAMAASYLKLQATYKSRCKVQPTCKEARIGTNPSLLAVEIAVRITG